MAGEVRLGSDGRRAHKPGQLVADDVAVAVPEGEPYVSRGATKLANALEALGLDPAGRRALDVGASTGGFTDCLLRRGAGGGGAPGGGPGGRPLEPRPGPPGARHQPPPA